MLVNFASLEPRQFEDLIGDLFHAEGYEVAYRAGVGPDDERDILLTYTSTGGLITHEDRYVVQCKCYTETVNRNDVHEVPDTVSQHGAQGFILAVSSNVSEPLQARLVDQSQQGGWKLLILRPAEIYQRLTAHLDVFLEYFPTEYRRFTELSETLTLADVRESAQQVFRLNLSGDEVSKLHKNAIVMDITDRPALASVYADRDLRSVVDSTYQRLLGRMPSDYEFLFHAAMVSRYPVNSRQGDFDLNVMRSPEFIARTPLSINWSTCPRGSLSFTEVFQEVFGLSTYHSQHKSGNVETVDSTVPAFGAAIRLSSADELEFRVWYSLQFPGKKRITINYYPQGELQFFFGVTCSDGERRFLQYIQGNGTDTTLNDRGTVYVQIHGSGVFNVLHMFEWELLLEEDLHRLTGTTVSSVYCMIVGIKGVVTIYNILLE
jgi:hypothetical protein